MEVPRFSPLDELHQLTNHTLSCTNFPQASSTESMACIFSHLGENKRRDLVSFEEMHKAHRTAAVASGQVYGLLVKIPAEQGHNRHNEGRQIEGQVSVELELTVRNSPNLFKNLGEQNDLPSLLSLGELWFPVPSSLVSLPSGASVTRQPIEHQRHRVTVRLDTLTDYIVVVSGDRICESVDQVVFESSWINPRSVGLFALNRSHYASLEEKGTFLAISGKSFFKKMKTSLKPELVNETVQVLAPWFASPAQVLPQINVLFLPLPVCGDHLVFGNTLVLEQSLIPSDGFVEDQLLFRSKLAEGVSSLWVARNMPAFSDVWLPAGIAAMLAYRVIEFSLGSNEYVNRLHARRSKYHAQVARGLEWRPLPLIMDPYDAVLRSKSGLVFETLRRSVVTDSDLRSAFHELATVAGGKKGPIDSDAFFFHLLCSVGQHTEAGSKLPKFKEEWVKCCGVPVFHVGFSLLDKRRFQVHVSQAPLSSRPSTATVNKRANDFVCRSDSAEGTSYMRPHPEQAVPAKYRFWAGELEVSIYRATGCRVTASVEMLAAQSAVSADSTSLMFPTHTTTLTVPFVTPRKHEVVLNRQSRDDELVHGWMCVMDDSWLMAKVVLVQSPLMWTNMLMFSQSAAQQLTATEALKHVKGSPVVLENLSEVLDNPQFFYRVRQEAGNALVNLSVSYGEREAGTRVFGWLENWIGRLSVEKNFWSLIEPRDFLTVAAVLDTLSLAKRKVDSRDVPRIERLFSSFLGAVEIALTRENSKTARCKVHPDLALATAIRCALFTLVNGGNLAASFDQVVRSISVRIQSDLYGAPLASENLCVLETVVSAVPPLGPTAGIVAPVSLSGMEKIALAFSNNRKLEKAAIRAYLILLGNGADSESAWGVRLNWVLQFSKRFVTGDPAGFTSFQSIAWLIDAWELLLERASVGESNKPSPIHQLMLSRHFCDKVWAYMCYDCMQLPIMARSAVTNAVTGIYYLCHGLSVPAIYDVNLPLDKDSTGPMSFWLPFKEHDRMYKRLASKGGSIKVQATNAAVQSKSSSVLGESQPPKKARLVISGAGSIPIGTSALRQ